MHGRSLVRTLDAGAIIIMVIAIGTLSLMAWTTRLIDRSAYENEVTLVRQSLIGLAADFRDHLPNPGQEPDGWLARDVQNHATFTVSPAGRFVTGRPGSRIHGLLSEDGTATRLEQALQVLERIDPQGGRVDLVRVGPPRDENLVFVSLIRDVLGQGRLAVALIDFSPLTSTLEGFGLHLQPIAARPGDILHANGRMGIDGLDGDPVAFIGWRSERISKTITGLILPILATALAAGLFVLMLLRRYWSQARDGFLGELKQVETLAHTDPLTGLPNRRALFEHLQTFAPSTRPVPPMTVLMLDLDGFKSVNDQHGHQAGDRVLKQAAEVFRTELGTAGFVARLGGDEFVALLPEIVNDGALQRLHYHLQQALRQRVPMEGLVPIGVSIGAVNSTTETGDGEDLLKMADLAVYAAKAAGRGLAMCYHPDMKRDIAYRRMLERELRGAILTQALFLAYQPIVDALSGQALGYEALVRWQHPVRGVISPTDFIPIAEKSDIIIGLGNFVLDRALAELGPHGSCRISVNATGRQLLAPGFIDFVMDALARHGVAAERLCLELTETSIISDPDSLATIMETLQGRGIRFAIDDFGAGYSSLTHLLRFKFDVLKIDRGFIASLDDKPEAPMIVTSVVSLARSLGMQVVGEGIETPAQQRFLASAGCGALQGYLFGRPVPIRQLGLVEDTKPTTLDSPVQAA
ncbi:MAG: putative bifunctional diguanylate cyclase/phosphodiesterase [Rhabdaerophilum sp.]